MISKMISKRFTIVNEDLKQFKNKENQNNDDQFLSISSDLALQFAIIIKNLLNNNDPLNLAIEKRCKIVEELINLTEKEDEKLEIEKRFQQTHDLFQSIVYTYSTNAIYRQFNRVLASDEYHKILEKHFVKNGRRKK